MEKEKINNSQYANWQYFQALRKHWSHHGHDGVPDLDCCCGFEGEGKPEICKIHFAIESSYE
jgi:hypothetical protein